MSEWVSEWVGEISHYINFGSISNSKRKVVKSSLALILSRVILSNKYKKSDGDNSMYNLKYPRPKCNELS